MEARLRELTVIKELPVPDGVGAAQYEILDVVN